jgi:hypothetical protein
LLATSSANDTDDILLFPGEDELTKDLFLDVAGMGDPGADPLPRLVAAVGFCPMVVGSEGIMSLMIPAKADPCSKIASRALLAKLGNW